VPVGTKGIRTTAAAERGIITAMYHLSIKIISRGKGRSAVAAAAYRAGEKMTNEYDGEIHDYTRKGGVIHTAVLLPENAPREYADRAVLWNAVEKIEKSKNSQLAREIEIALPKELTKEQNQFLVYEYVKEQFVRHGMCADIAIHDTGGVNPHAHIMLTMRPFEQGGKWGAKHKKDYILDKDGNKIYDPKKRQYKANVIPSTDWNEQTKAEEWRAAWADIVNATLERNNHEKRVDHRSYARQSKEQIPTVHLGAAASQMERRGIRTERGDINREIEVTNQKLRQLKARLDKLQTWLKDEQKNTEPPTLADVITNVLNQREQNGERSRYGSIHNLKAAANILNFLTDNNITDMSGLNEKLDTMKDKQYTIREELKKAERRVKTLDEHLWHGGNFKKYRGQKSHYEKLYSEYQTIKNAGGLFAERKAQKALDFANSYYESNRMEITLFEAAERYMKDVLQKRYEPKKLPPITKWKAERETLNGDLQRLNSQYFALKNEVGTVEKIRLNITDIMQEQTRIKQRAKENDMEL